MAIGNRKIKFSFNTALLVIWFIIFVFIAIKAPGFLKWNYIVDVMLRNIVEIGMIALPMTLIIITAGIDLSVGNIMVLSCMLGGMAASLFGDAVAVIVTLLVGAGCGFLNGFIIAKIKITPMVTTLATMYLFLGLARGITKGESIYTYGFADYLGNTEILNIPIQIWIFAILAVLFIYLLLKTTLGRQIYSIGLNPNASRYSGIETDKIIILIYVITGLICSLAAFIWLGRFTSIKYDAGTNFSMKVITVVVLGGTSINGGVGDMRGTILGALIIATLNSGLTVLNIPIDVQTILQGAVLMIALIAYAVVNSRAKKKKILRIVDTAEVL